MNEYIIYTMEGQTMAPNTYVNVENCQVLGHAMGISSDNAIDNLFDDNPWIETAGFDKSECLGVQILSNTQKDDISTVLDYLWKDEYTHYQESHYVKNHIFRVIKRLRDMVK